MTFPVNAQNRHTIVLDPPAIELLKRRTNILSSQNGPKNLVAKFYGPEAAKRVEIGWQHQLPGE